MPILTTVGTDERVNTNAADGQIIPRVVQLADGKYMVIWVGPVTLPVVITGGTFAPSYANADIRAQIYNADGTVSGGEIVINATTAGGQLRPVVTQLSDGNVIISWHDGVGPAGGPSETTMNAIRAQEFTSAGAATGSEFIVGNSNGRQHSMAATADGGFVATFQEGGVGGTFAAGNILARTFNSNNVQTSTFVIDNTQPLSVSPFTTVEADGDIIVYLFDRGIPFNPNVSAWRYIRYDANGNQLDNNVFSTTTSIQGIVRLATGGHAVLMTDNGSFFATMTSADGSLTRTVDISSTTGILFPPTITALANGGFLVSWGVDSDPGTSLNGEIMARAFNAIGNPIGDAFQVNYITTGNQSAPSFAQLTNGDIIATWIDESQLTGDTSGTAINMRRIDYDATNRAPTATDFALSLPGVAPGQAETIDPYWYDGFIGPNGYDADGDPLTITGISNVINGSATLNPDGTITLITNAGATGRLSFDYTVSDGQGGFATARATITLPTDYVTLRPGEERFIDFLANDFYTPAAGATPFALSPPLPVNGGTIEGVANLVQGTSRPFIYYDPIPSYNSSYFNLLVGQTTQVRINYYNNETAADVLVTLEGWAQLGGTGDDSLTGTAQSDHLSGGGGVNVLTGLGGNDWYTVESATTTVVEATNEGVDNVRTTLATYTLTDNVENLYGLTGAVNLYGNALDNIIIGASFLYGMGGNDRLTGSNLGDTLDGGEGNDNLNGGFGDDILIGGAGSDTLIGGSGNDTASYASSTVGLTISLASGGISSGDALGDTFNSIERVIGSAFDDTIIGSSADENLDGGGGVDQLYGGGGSDVLTLGTGANGSSVDGGAGVDTLAVTSNITSLAQIISLDNIQFFNGASLTLTGSQFATGIVRDPGSPNGVFIISGTGNLTVNMDPGVLFTTREFFVASSASIIVNGTAGSDIMRLGSSSINYGGYGLHTVYAGDGADTIEGGGNREIVYGGAGNDTISGGGGGDQLDGGDGFDMLVYNYDYYGSPLSIDRRFLTSGTHSVDTFNATETVSNFEVLRLIGTAYGDTLRGSTALQNQLIGGAGDDQLYGGDQNDALYGDDGADVLDGGSGADSLFGGGGNDRFIVGTGDGGTIVNGGLDTDTLVVTGSVSLGGLSGIEAIEFQAGASLTLTGAQFAGLAFNSTLSGTGSLVINVAPGDFNVFLAQLSVLAGSNITITVNGSSGADVIKGAYNIAHIITAGAGSDLLRGGILADILNGGEGTDKIEGGPGADILTGGADADQFRYQTADASGTGSAADRITDFAIGQDRIVLSLIDTDPVAAGDQGFAFIGTGVFSATNTAEIRYMNSGSDILVQADINGDGTADMEFILEGIAGQILTGGDFVL